VDKTKLELVFLNEDGKKFVLSMDNPREDLTDVDVSQAMGQIIEDNVFLSSMFDLVESLEARVVTTTISTFAI